MQLPVIGRSNIIDAANMLSRHNRAVKVDPNYMVIRITGEHASFSVPGTRAESVTYEFCSSVYEHPKGDCCLSQQSKRKLQSPDD